MCQDSIGKASHLAIETSGHGALKENHWLDDGAYLMVSVFDWIILLLRLLVLYAGIVKKYSLIK